MKTSRSNTWTSVCAFILLAMAVLRSSADPTTTTARAEKGYAGTIVAIDAKERVLTVKWWAMFKKSFNLGDNCAVSQLENSHAEVSDLRPGEKVSVGYEKANGVLIANRIEQEPMRFEGMIKAIAPDHGSIMLHGSTMDQQWLVANDCKITLRNGKPGTFNDIQLGSHVTVTYETPDDQRVIRQISQTSITFAGTLKAIDLVDKTLKANSAFDSKEFHVADNCTIMMNGKPDGHLADLELNDQFVFSYDEIDGVNVVNRIAPAGAQTNSVAATRPATVN